MFPGFSGAGVIFILLDFILIWRGMINKVFRTLICKFGAIKFTPEIIYPRVFGVIKFTPEVIIISSIE